MGTISRLNRLAQHYSWPRPPAWGRTCPNPSASRCTCSWAGGYAAASHRSWRSAGCRGWALSTVWARAR
eukprot:1466834-Prymnesium_polylepis.3